MTDTNSSPPRLEGPVPVPVDPAGSDGPAPILGFRPGMRLPAPVLVFGAGRSGVVAARALDAAGVPFVLHDERPESAFAGDAGLAGLTGPGRTGTFCLGSRPAALLDTVASCVASPGIPPTHPLLVELSSRGLPIVSEVELGYRISRAPLIAVTGSNGKTSAVTMIDLLLRAAGLRSIASGNIGYAFCGAVLEHPDVDWHVVEVSSFQLAFTDRFHPRVAVVTNFAPNHLDWHGSQAGYLEAKLRITRNLEAGDHIVFDAQSPELPSRLSGGPASSLAVGTGSAIEIEDDGPAVVRVAPDGHRVPMVELADLARELPYDVRQVRTALLMTVGVALELGLDLERIREVLERFRPLPHRLESVAEKAGVLFINDSKATSTPATVYALARQTRPVVLILGGRDKGLDFGRVLDGARTPVRAVVAYGEAASKIRSQLEGQVALEVEDRLEDAVRIAGRIARAGDTVLFSPGCASFDQHRNFEERGDHFKRVVGEIAA